MVCKSFVLFVSFLGLFATTQAFWACIKDVYGNVITPCDHKDDSNTRSYQIKTPGYPERYMSGLHYNWHAEPNTPNFSVHCVIDFEKQVTGAPCDPETPTRLEVHYTDCGSMAKDIYCGSTQFSLQNVRLLDIFIAPDVGGAVKCDISNKDYEILTNDIEA